jgi:signal peptidase I
VIVALALGLALGIQAFLIKPYRIPSGSMKPTITETQRVLVNRFIYHFTSPKVGDIVVFHPPASADDDDQGRQCTAAHKPGQPCPRNDDHESDANYIKRIVAGPGDTLRIVGGLAIVNGRADPLANGHICRRSADCDGAEICPKPVNPRTDRAADDCNFQIPITVPPGHFFMMGDNRGSSDDSRFWGPVPQSWFIGKAFATYWPPRRVGLF